MRGSFYSPPVAQDVQQLRREHDVAILLPFALFDPDDHPFAINVGDFQSDGLGDSQASRVAGGQDRPMFDTRYAGEELEHFFGAEDEDLFQAPRFVECGFVEEPQSGHCDEDGSGCQLPFIF